VKATLFVREHPCLINDAIFSGEPMEGMKSDAFMFIELRQMLAKQGILLATQDIHDPTDSAFVLCVDNVLPMQSLPKRTGQQFYLLLSEPATYHPHNYDPANQRVFDKIFTYDYTWVDNIRVFPYRFAIDFETYAPFQTVSADEFAQRKLCTLVAASFGVSAPRANSGSLLHERYLALKWFSEHQPGELDFYCRGLNMQELESIRGAAVLRKILPQAFFTWLGKQRKQVFDRVYRGAIPPDDKIKQLRQYRFAFAYENTGNVPGYITEKPFDCFAAAVVPIYLGDPKVQDSIPPACFVDKRKFSTYEALYAYLYTMQYSEYRGYIDAIETFWHSTQITELTSEANARLITRIILQDIQPEAN
jgi:hypothetical protein